MPRSFIALLGACLLLAGVPSVQAQVRPPADESEVRPRLYLGPLGVTPKISIQDIGVDTNVFRTANGAESDFTTTIGPGVDTWLRLGRARLRSSTQLDWIYFQKFDQQRSFNLSEDARLDLDLVRVTPFLRGNYTRTRQQPNPEIDIRVRQRRTLAGGGIGIRFGPNFVVEAEGLASQLALDDENPDEAFLADALNRKSRTGSVAARWRLTPLTTLVVKGEALRDEFERNSLRDSRSFTLLPGIELRPLALISGHAYAGVKRFATDAASLPDFTGLVADVEVSWMVRDLTQFGVRVNRNVEYSFDQTEPYFLLTDFNLEVRQALGYDWDVVGRAGVSKLGYRSVSSGTSVTGTDRTDWADIVGAGFGRRFGDDVRIGVDLDRVSRRSPRPDREYQGFRIGGSFTYGY